MLSVTTDAFSRAQSVTNAFGGRARPDLLGELQRSPRSIAAIGGEYLLLREREETGKSEREGEV